MVAAILKPALSKQKGLYRLHDAANRMYRLFHGCPVSFGSNSIQRYEMLKVIDWIMRLNAVDDK